MHPLVGGHCPACQLAGKVQRLRQRGDAHAVSVLEPYLHALASAPNAATTMRWMHGPTMALLTDLLAGRLAVTHAALDEAQGSAADCGSVAFLRAALTHHGVLEQRDEASASFARWHQHATMSVVSHCAPTHRIGQTRPVMVYRMIARETIEEKVVALARRKAALFSGVMDEGDLFASSITAEDIRGLLG